MSIATLILAGGKGTRMGGADKAFLPLHGDPLIKHVLNRLGPKMAPIAISANGDATRFAAYNLPVLADSAEFAGKGPLAGVAAGLAWAETAGATSLLTLPVDTPFFPANLAKALSPAPSVACFAGRQHHLISLWLTAFRPELEEFLRRPGRYKVRDALTHCGARPVAFSGSTDPFLNLNTPDDFAAL